MLILFESSDGSFGSPGGSGSLLNKKFQEDEQSKSNQTPKSSTSIPTSTLSTPNTISQLTTNTPIEVIMNMLNNRLEVVIEPKP